MGVNDHTKRCVVYTRKSTEDGLELKYNSLDAQYDACSAYIRSQIGMGGTLVDKRYDDGGYSGGNTKRPGLTELLADIEAGLVDAVVVYKIDRLSRSVMDFADLFKTFEKHHVSFVSVTQQIDTSNAAGRMMLNILMSFAQFEREMSADRVRDKIYQAKQKGMWVGESSPMVTRRSTSSSSSSRSPPRRWSMPSSGTRSLARRWRSLANSMPSIPVSM